MTWITISLQQETMDNSSLDSSVMNVAFIGESRGRLHYVDDYKLLVWILNGDREWIFKYNINTSRIFGDNLSDLGDYSLVAIHPKCNTIIFNVRGDNLLLSYHMDHEEVRVLASLSSYFDGRSSYPIFHMFSPTDPLLDKNTCSFSETRSDGWQ
jgi:hypothetical protein